MPSTQGKGLNIFGLLSRDNTFRCTTTQGQINSAFIIRELETLAFSIRKRTVVVLDNARVHTSKTFQERREAWEKRGLFIFYLPPYSPHLNLIEILWRKLKYDWLRPADYLAQDHLFYAVTQILAAIGNSLSINFAKSMNSSN